MADTIMTYGSGAGQRIGGGTQPREREYRCAFPHPMPAGCGLVIWSFMERPECPASPGHGRMIPVPSPAKTRARGER